MTCLVRMEGQVRKLYAANAGDARAVLCRNGAAVRITRDHKASDQAEQERVQQSGGWVSMNRVHGVLAVSRALGDHAMKQSVISEPNFWEGELTGEMMSRGLTVCVVYVFVERADVWAFDSSFHSL